MKDLIRKFKRKQQFRKNMKNWIRLCKRDPKRSGIKIGIQKVGEITHSIIEKMDSRNLNLEEKKFYKILLGRVEGRLKLKEII